MFTRSLESQPLSRWDCGLTLSCILGKPDRRLGAGRRSRADGYHRTQILPFGASWLAEAPPSAFADGGAQISLRSQAVSGVR